MKYTYEQTLDLLNEIVSSKGEDYVYPHSDPDSEQACRYYEREIVGTWSPSCLVGHVFDRVLDEDTVAKVISLYNTAGISSTSVLSLVSPFFDDKSISLLSGVQGRQDNGRTWGESVKDTDSIICWWVE